jgi:hypothetical protein
LLSMTIYNRIKGKLGNNSYDMRISFIFMEGQLQPLQVVD